MNVDFRPKGHPKGVELTDRQKMLFLRIENEFQELSREITQYLAPNPESSACLEKLFESREFALKSLMKDDMPGGARAHAASKETPLTADNFPGFTGRPKPVAKPLQPEVIDEEKDEAQTAFPIESAPASKKNSKKTGKAQKTAD
jgi:hypothetical protein